MMEQEDNKEIRTKLLILADDLTGALDAGVQFAKKGDRVRVCTVPRGAFTYTGEADVLVIDTESRHIGKDEAYRLVYGLTREARQAGIPRIYKKTDSGLRGNVGAELSAVLAASGEERLEFLPAWPEMGRMTKDGIHYVGGVPLDQSIFAQDVLDPVTESRIDRLIRLQSETDVTRHGDGDEHGIVVYDCTSEEELAEAARYIAANGFRLAAGCAGLLAEYPKQSDRTETEKEIILGEELLVLSGSMNEVTGRQLAKAQEHGAFRVHIPAGKAAAGTWTEEEIRVFAEDFLKHARTGTAIIDTMGDHEGSGSARLIADSMGQLALSLVRTGMNKTLMIIGGDTLQGFIRKAGISSLSPVRELAPGTVLSGYEYQGNEHYLITRSGGFGPEEQLLEIQQDLSRR